nr:IS66 family transposase [Myxococcus qinghaiensis]
MSECGRGEGEEEAGEDESALEHGAERTSTRTAHGMTRPAPEHPPKSPLGLSLRSTKGQWSALTRFLDDPSLPLDNNAAERVLRAIAAGGVARRQAFKTRKSRAKPLT